MSRRKAKQESQPWEILLSTDGAKPEFCCRERSRQGGRGDSAQLRFWKPDDESLIDAASPYSQSEKRAETEGPREDTKKSGGNRCGSGSRSANRGTRGSTSTLG